MRHGGDGGRPLRGGDTSKSNSRREKKIFFAKTKRGEGIRWDRRLKGEASSFGRKRISDKGVLKSSCLIPARGRIWARAEEGKRELNCWCWGGERPQTGESEDEPRILREISREKTIVLIKRRVHRTKRGGKGIMGERWGQATGGEDILNSILSCQSRYRLG